MELLLAWMMLAGLMRAQSQLCEVEAEMRQFYLLDFDAISADRSLR